MHLKLLHVADQACSLRGDVLPAREAEGRLWLALVCSCTKAYQPIGAARRLKRMLRRGELSSLVLILGFTGRFTSLLVLTLLSGNKGLTVVSKPAALLDHTISSLWHL